MLTHRILIINPNSNQVMTDSLRPILDSIKLDNVRHQRFQEHLTIAADSTQVTYDLFTAPDGPNSINNEDDAEESQKHCLPSLKKIAHQYDAFLVACYSAHPLVPTLKEMFPSKHVLGIFEASVVAALAICGQSRHEPEQLTWGIVTTGKAWEPLLTAATHSFFGIDDQSSAGSRAGRFAGVQSTGMNADELHDAPKALLRERLTQATRRLLDGVRAGQKLKAVALGCAGMAELEGIVREVVPSDVRIVDGVTAGYCNLAMMLIGGI